MTANPDHKKTNALIPRIIHHKGEPFCLRISKEMSISRPLVRTFLVLPCSLDPIGSRMFGVMTLIVNLPAKEQGLAPFQQFQVGLFQALTFGGHTIDLQPLVDQLGD